MTAPVETTLNERAAEWAGEQVGTVQPVPEANPTSTAPVVASVPEPAATEVMSQPVGTDTEVNANAAADVDTGEDTPADAGGAASGVGDVREQARAAWRDSVAAGAPLTGRELGERFGRSERWGRDRVAEARQDGTTGGATGAAGTGASTSAARRRRTAAGKSGRGTVSAAAGTRSARQDASGTPTAGVPAGTASVGEPELPSERQPQNGPAVPDAAVPAVPVVLPAGARLVAWAGFLFGTVISVAANVLYAWLPHLSGKAAEPGLAPQVGAAVWPIALVISVEVLSRVPWRPGWAWYLARYGGAGVVAIGAAVISYGHLRGVLAAWGYGTTGAAVGPLVVDGLMTISGFALLAMSSHGKAATR